MPTPRFKNDSGVLVIRNDADTENGALVVGTLKITENNPDTGRILTSDNDGNGTWQDNTALEIANEAKETADDALSASQSAFDAASAAESVANQALTDAAAAYGLAETADIAAAGASAAAAAAAAEATAAAAAAAVAAGLATAAGIDAANAQTTADNAQTTANIALTNALQAFPDSMRFFGDELLYVAGTPTSTTGGGFPYNWVTYATADGSDARITLNLRGGKWTFKFLTVTGTGSGRVTITVGSAVLADPEDLYTAVQNQAKVYTYPNVTISSSDRYEIRFLTNGRNGSSSGFAVTITKFWGYRTGD